MNINRYALEGPMSCGLNSAIGSFSAEKKITYGDDPLTPISYPSPIAGHGVRPGLLFAPESNRLNAELLS
jgi:hypothetical protein